LEDCRADARMEMEGFSAMNQRPKEKLQFTPPREGGQEGR
jgi:hypothetical protein